MHRRRLNDMWRIRSPRGGFTLLEVALAVLIVGTALVALTRMLTLGRLVADTDAERVVALSILREQAALVKARGSAALEDQVATALDEHPGYWQALDVTNAGDGLKLVKVTVSWNSPTGREVSESAQFIVSDAVLPVRSWEAP